MTEKTAENQSPSSIIKRGLTAGLPITISYLPVAITFGVLAKQSGMGMFDLTMMSVLIYAGAGQFMGVNMFAVGAGALEMIIAIFVLNFRHFIMSFSFMNNLRKVPLKIKASLALGLTDETFTVSAMIPEEGQKEKGYLFYIALFLSAYLSWVIGTLIGGLIGDVIPEKLSQSMGIALYAMFIVLLVPSVKKEIRFGLIAIFAMIVNAFASQFISSGWAIVVGTVVGGFSGVFLLKEEKK